MKRRGGGYDLHTHNNRKEGAENAVWRDSFDGDVFNMFAHHLRQKKAVIFCVCPTHFWSVPGDDPRIWVTKGTSGREMSQVPKPLLFLFSDLRSVFFLFFFVLLSLSTPEPWYHYTALCLKLSRCICIEKLFAYQTAGPQSSHHLSLIYREMLTLTCWSACPLYLHLPFAAVS